MEIIFNKDNSITVVNKEGEYVFQHNQHTFSVTQLKQLGFSNAEINQVEHILKKRKYSFYT